MKNEKKRKEKTQLTIEKKKCHLCKKRFSSDAW